MRVSQLLISTSQPRRPAREAKLLRRALWKGPVVVQAKPCRVAWACLQHPPQRSTALSRRRSLVHRNTRHSHPCPYLESGLYHNEARGEGMDYSLTKSDFVYGIHGHVIFLPVKTIVPDSYLPLSVGPLCSTVTFSRASESSASSGSSSNWPS